jgi:hypothetical protein|tara:strand:- start:1395 stop:1721 length:327 start_codon:yes stop_codon:yes gene_type:complete
MNLNETIYGSNYILGKDVTINGKNKIEDITILEYMKELEFITHSDDVDELAVVWGVMEEEQYIEQVYNHDTGEIYWENPDIEWTENDDNLIIALLMYGDLEQTIGELV